MLMSLAYHYVPAEPAPKKSLTALKLHVIDNSLLSITFFLIRMLLFLKLSYSNANFENFLKKQGTISNRALSETFTTTLLLVCYTAVFSVVTQCSSPQKGRNVEKPTGHAPEFSTFKTSLKCADFVF